MNRALAFTLVALGCGAPPTAVQPSAPGGVSRESAVVTAPGHAAGQPVLESRAPATTEPACPPEMASIASARGAFCIDRWEASLARRAADGTLEPWPGNQRIDGQESEMVAQSLAGRKPQGYVSGTQAALACQAAGKRLCALDEWRRSCRGAADRSYPYGKERREGACNDRYRVMDAHPVVRLFEVDRSAEGGRRKHNETPGADRARMWSLDFMNDPRLHELSRSVEPSGALPACRSEEGVYDLVGNLHEWVADPEGTFVGGFFMDTLQNGEGCDYRTTAHSVEYHDYSTGFRCCRSAAE